MKKGKGVGEEVGTTKMMSFLDHPPTKHQHKLIKLNVEAISRHQPSKGTKSTRSSGEAFTTEA